MGKKGDRAWRKEVGGGVLKEGWLVLAWSKRLADWHKSRQELTFDFLPALLHAQSFQWKEVFGGMARMGLWNMLTQTQEKTQRDVCRVGPQAKKKSLSGRWGDSLAAAVVFHCSLERIGLLNGHMITRPRSHRRLWESAASRGCGRTWIFSPTPATLTAFEARRALHPTAWQMYFPHKVQHGDLCSLFHVVASIWKSSAPLASTLFSQCAGCV